MATTFSTSVILEKKWQSMTASVAHCIASSKQGTTSEISRLHSKLNHNGVNHKDTRVEQNSKTTLGMKCDIVIQRYMSRQCLM